MTTEQTQAQPITRPSEVRSDALFDTARFHAVALEVEFEYGMGGLCSTVYEEWAMDICKRYVSNSAICLTGGGKDGGR